MTHIGDDRRPTDEIDLGDMIRSLWASKVLFFITFLTVLAIAAAYAFLSTPIYQASVHLLPPTISDVARYNVASQLTGEAISATVPDTAPGIAPLTPDAAYKAFLRYLRSSTVRQRFFDEYYLPEKAKNGTEAERQRAWRQLDEDLTITLPTRDQLEASITLLGEDAQLIAKWANAYVHLAAEAAAEDLLNGLVGEVEVRKRSLEDQIAAVRLIAQNIRESHITRLKAALTIAESIALETPADGSPLIAINTKDLNAEGVNSGSLLYLRGSKALRSELDQLKQRDSDDAYIAELPNLLKKQALLAKIDFNPGLLSVVTIDQMAIPPEEPIKPKKAPILVLGIIIGTILGIIMALIRHASTR